MVKERKAGTQKHHPPAVRHVHTYAYTRPCRVIKYFVRQEEDHCCGCYYARRSNAVTRLGINVALYSPTTWRLWLRQTIFHFYINTTILQ